MSGVYAIVGYCSYTHSYHKKGSVQNTSQINSVLTTVDIKGVSGKGTGIPNLKKILTITEESIGDAAKNLGLKS